MSLIGRIMIFLIIHIGVFAASFMIEWMRNLLPFILIIPLVSYLILFFMEAKSSINKGLSYDEVWHGCFWFSFWAGASLTLPFMIFRVGPDGPFEFGDFSIGYFIGYPIGCAVLGALAGLVGTVLINQFYGVLGGNKAGSLERNSRQQGRSA